MSDIKPGERVRRGSNYLLRLLYLSFNKKFFGNSLPKDLPVGFKKMPKELGRAAFHKQTNRPLWINIDESLRCKPAQCRMTLIHEMCHVKNKHARGHGYKFDREMIALAKRGAFNGLW